VTTPRADALPLLYTDLAEWFHLVTAPTEYAEEASFYFEHLRRALGRPIETVLELGAGGGNNAWHYKQWAGRVTLTDPAPAMLALSQRVNPDCEHLIGDMRDLRLGRLFDVVFVHDAISYLLNLADLRRAFETAFVHTRPGGVALFAPDALRETYRDDTDCGGHDGSDGRGLRYLEWTFDPDPKDETYQTDYTFVLRELGQPTRVVLDEHRQGLFSRADWLRLLSEVGFQADAVPFEHSEEPPGSLEIFLARRSA
jgi:hypothetical protein